jgi:DNA-binding transcriptional regulator LsrR (DeoR family)
MNTRERKAMPESITSDQVVGAARDIGQAEFTRDDLAKKLGVEKRDLREGFREARQSGRLEKVRDDEQGTGHFRLTDQ